MAPSITMPLPLAPLVAASLSMQSPPSAPLGTSAARMVFYIGPALHHYRTFFDIGKDTNRQRFSDTVEFCHSYLTQPSLTAEDKLFHVMSILTCALKDAPTATYNAQLDANRGSS